MLYYADWWTYGKDMYVHAFPKEQLDHHHRKPSSLHPNLLMHCPSLSLQSAPWGHHSRAWLHEDSPRTRFEHRHPWLHITSCCSILICLLLYTWDTIMVQWQRQLTWSNIFQDFSISPACCMCLTRLIPHPTRSTDILNLREVTIKILLNHMRKRKKKKRKKKEGIFNSIQKELQLLEVL